VDRSAWAGSAVVLALFLAAWQWGPGMLSMPEFILPPLSRVVEEFGRMAADDLWMHTGITALEIVVGFVLGALLGVGAGVSLGLSPRAEAMLSPYILALQIAPKVAFAPLFIMWFGFNSMPKLLVTVLIVFFPVLVNVLQAMKTVDRDILNLARAYTLTRWQIFWKVQFPSTLPSLMAGLRIASTLAVIGVTVGELVGGNTGLGFLISFGSGQANAAMVFNAIILLTLIGIALYSVLTWIEARLLHYIPRSDH
jgi:NitT/TauT family transport system permease protein